MGPVFLGNSFKLLFDVLTNCCAKYNWYQQLCLTQLLSMTKSVARGHQTTRCYSV